MPEEETATIEATEAEVQGEETLQDDLTVLPESTEAETEVTAEGLAEELGETLDVTGDEKPDATDEPDWSSEVLNQGLEAGFTEEEIKDFGDPDRFTKAMATMDRRSLNSFDQQITAQPYTGPGMPQAPSVQPIQPQQQAPAPFSADPLELKLDAENVDESIVNAFAQMNSHYATQNQAMQQAMGQMIQFAQAQQQQQFVGQVEQMDSYLTGLGKDFEPQFGAGQTMNLTRNTAAWANRDKLYSSAEKLAEMYRSQGRHVPSIQTRLQRALALEFPDSVQTQARNEVNGRVEKRRKQLSHRPTRRVGKAATPEEQAYDNAAAIFKDRNIADVSQGGGL